MPRFGVFSLIGLTGFALQTVLLAWLTRVLGWQYFVAVPTTAELMVLMSFVSHSLWTWADRPVCGLRPVVQRLLRYQAVRGLAVGLSYAVTLGLVSMYRVPPELANALSVGAVSFLNFAVSDRVIFERG